MRRFLLAATAISMLFAFTPSHAAWRTISKRAITFKAQTPCTAVCPYNINAVAAAVPYVPGVGYPTRGKFDSCGAPFPPGSWADYVVTAPRLSNTLIFRIDPTLDWDSFICSKPARGASRELGSGTNSVDTSCAYGCREEISIRVRPGTKYILRAYNFSDVNTLPADYRFLRVT